MPQIVLASTSPFRRELLTRLQLSFQCYAPNICEDARDGELPRETAERLAVEKAQAAAADFPGALIIGSDQVAYMDSMVFGKPGTAEKARAQLRAMSGREIVFHTGLCLFNSASGRFQLKGVETRVGFRHLNDGEIDSYIAKENALNCAGSAKSEGLGISLLTYIRGDDPNALIGLPLLALCDMLRTEGIPLP